MIDLERLVLVELTIQHLVEVLHLLVHSMRKYAMVYLLSVPIQVLQHISLFIYLIIKFIIHVYVPAAILTLDNESGLSILLAKNKIGILLPAMSGCCNSKSNSSFTTTKTKRYYDDFIRNTGFLCLTW